MKVFYIIKRVSLGHSRIVSGSGQHPTIEQSTSPDYIMDEYPHGASDQGSADTSGVHTKGLAQGLEGPDLSSIIPMSSSSFPGADDNVSRKRWSGVLQTEMLGHLACDIVPLLHQRSGAESYRAIPEGVPSAPSGSAGTSDVG